MGALPNVDVIEQLHPLLFVPGQVAPSNDEETTAFLRLLNAQGKAVWQGDEQGDNWKEN